MTLCVCGPLYACCMIAHLYDVSVWCTCVYVDESILPCDTTKCV